MKQFGEYVCGANYITEKHKKWIEGGAYYNKVAVLWAQLKLNDFTFRGKPARVSPSSLGTCPRRQVFAIRGYPVAHTPLKSWPIHALNGDFAHIRWQMAGLSAGWLKKAEVFRRSAVRNFSGTLDGVCADGSGFELKTTKSDRYSQICVTGPPMEHLLQVNGYMNLEPRIKVFSIIYENRDSLSFKEFRIEKDPKLQEQINKTIKYIHTNVRDRTNPAILDPCKQHKGLAFDTCPFSATCLALPEGTKME